MTKIETYNLREEPKERKFEFAQHKVIVEFDVETIRDAQILLGVLRYSLFTDDDLHQFAKYKDILKSLGIEEPTEISDLDVSYVAEWFNNYLEN